MDDNPLPYQMWVEESLREVVRRVLVKVERQGLPGDHHLYISFRTDDDGVRIPARLRSQHSGEMTIVLQNQFWDLEVGEDAFSVTLNFNRISERLRVPFAALTTFADPSVNFGLQLATVDDSVDATDGANIATNSSSDSTPGFGTEPGTTIPFRDTSQPAPDSITESGEESADKSVEKSDKNAGGDIGGDTEGDSDAGAAGEVVTLDSFRKK